MLAAPQQGPEAAAVETLILANRARELGMVVSDRTINDMLAELTFDSLTKEQLQAIIDSLHTGRRVSRRAAVRRDSHRDAGVQSGAMFQVSTVDFPPAQKFEFFSRLNRRAKAEVVPLAVADFTSQVKNPNDDMLQKFFDKYKDRFPDATSPDRASKSRPGPRFNTSKPTSPS